MYDVHGIGKVRFSGGGAGVFGTVNEALNQFASKSITDFFSGKKRPDNIVWYDIKGEPVVDLYSDGIEGLRKFIKNGLKLLAKK